MSEFKYYFTNTCIIIPEDVKGKSSDITVQAGIKPKIVKSFSEDVHEISDNSLFYTDITGQYNCIVYEFDGVRVTKYKQTNALLYNFCVKSVKPELIFHNFKVVRNQLFDVLYVNFDVDDFFDYKFEFCTMNASDLIVYSDGKYGKINNSIIEFKESAGIYLLSDSKIVKPKWETNINNINDTSGKSILCYDKTANLIMIWRPNSSNFVYGIIDKKQVKFVNNYRLNPNILKSDAIDHEIVKVYIDGKCVPDPNGYIIDTNASYKKMMHYSKNFGDIQMFNGSFDFMVKIHRSIIRDLYERFLYIDVLDIGIGKCRDVHSYSQYVNRNDIYGVEPNSDFSKHCTIRNMFNSTADEIFKFFKFKRLNKKFHTIVFCNSYNFVTNPYITLKECEEVLNTNGRIIMVYMNNDKVVTVKNEDYEMRKGEKNSELSDSHVLQGKQNFIEVFRETTLVPPHYENQISENDILNALDKVNKYLTESKKPQLELIEKGNLVHPVYSEWLNENAKLFNSMFYYAVIGRECKFDKIIIAFDPHTTTLKEFINYLHKKKTFCSGVELTRYADYIKNKDKLNNPVICITELKQYDELKKLPCEILVNIQNINELEYSSIYTFNGSEFISERKKFLDLNIPHTKFGFPENDRRN